MTTTTTTLVYPSLTGDDVPVKRVRLALTVEAYAYVPVDYRPYVEGTEHAEAIESAIGDALDYHCGYLTDFEPTDSLLVLDGVRVEVNAFEDVEPDPDMNDEQLVNLVEARADGA